jgi:hypothetical protein
VVKPVAARTSTGEPICERCRRAERGRRACGRCGHYRLGYTGSDPQHGPDAVSITTPDGSRIEITLATTNGEHLVNETGPVRLWQQLECAHQQWDQAAGPAGHGWV